MDHNAIILELLSRIKVLEDDVASMKAALETDRDLAQHQDTATAFKVSAPTAYQRTTDEMIDICYKCGKKVHQGENVADLADEIADETGMNRNSAVMYLYAVSSMLSGTIYKRAISSKATQKYFDAIFNEFGSEGLKKAIQATRQHIDYRRDCGHMVDSIEEICKKYEHLL